MDIVAIIPARSGSKGIPGKNLARCGDHPLIWHTFQAALGARRLSRILLSTDDSEIAAFARQVKIEVPYSRNPQFALDESPMVPVLQEAVDWLEANGSMPDAVVLLQPTSPLRTAQHIDEAIELFISTGADTVVSVVEVPHIYSPASVLIRETTGRVRPFLSDTEPVYRRQDKPKVFARNGPAILIIKPSVIREGKLYGDKTYSYVMNAGASVDIDVIEDLRYADFLLRTSASRD